MNEPGTGPVRFVDDFAEFLTDSYTTVLAAFTANGLDVVVESGPGGQYLLVTKPVGARHAYGVEITCGGQPLPDSPDDVTVWSLTCGTTHTTVPSEAGTAALVAAVANLLARTT